MAIVYVLSNPAFDRYVKVGRTSDLEQRLRQLDNTSVPLPFRCEFAIEVNDEVEAERLVHQAFADVRVRSSREFFEIEPQRVIAALKLTGGKDVTPKEDVAEDAEGIEALERTVAKRRSYSFDDAHVSIGDVLVYTRDESVTATVVADKKIEFEGEVISLSRAALTLLHRDGYKWKQANGWAYWMKDGETMGERVERFAPTEDED
ncbi:MAG: GIY-YIG nuclease family protein [Porticoccaceae bacterium]|nr:GIY-YIG nuclease family protein [Porticoccaceae bacterium]